MSSLWRDFPQFRDFGSHNANKLNSSLSSPHRSSALIMLCSELNTLPIKVEASRLTLKFLLEAIVEL